MAGRMCAFHRIDLHQQVSLRHGVQYITTYQRALLCDTSPSQGAKDGKKGVPHLPTYPIDRYYSSRPAILFVPHCFHQYSENECQTSCTNWLMCDSGWGGCNLLENWVLGMVARSSLNVLYACRAEGRSFGSLLVMQSMTGRRNSNSPSRYLWTSSLLVSSLTNNQNAYCFEKFRVCHSQNIDIQLVGIIRYRFRKLRGPLLTGVSNGHVFIPRRDSKINEVVPQLLDFSERRRPSIVQAISRRKEGLRVPSVREERPAIH